MIRNRNVISWDDVPIIMDLPFASRIVGLRADYLSKLSKEGKFPAEKVSNSWRVEKVKLREYLNCKEETE